jgi:hypothetical protein
MLCAAVAAVVSFAGTTTLRVQHQRVATLRVATLAGSDFSEWIEDCFMGTVLLFLQKFTLEDAIGSTACSLEASMRVTNGIPRGNSLSYLLTL